MAGLTCADRMFHRHYADFDFFEYKKYLNGDLPGPFFVA